MWRRHQSREGSVHSLPSEASWFEENISHNYKEHSLVHSVTGAGEGEETPQTFGRLGPIYIPNQIRPLGRWRSAFSLLRYIRFLKIGKVDRPVRRGHCTRADIRIGDSRTRSPNPSVFEPLDPPMDALCLDLELPLQGRAVIQVVKGIQFKAIAPDPTGCVWASRAFGPHSAGGSGMVTLAWAGEDIALGRSVDRIE